MFRTRRQSGSQVSSLSMAPFAESSTALRFNVNTVVMICVSSRKIKAWRYVCRRYPERFRIHASISLSPAPGTLNPSVK
jgi:hypothetical protein